MLENIKLMLGEAAGNYNDDLINLFIKQSISEVETYCNRVLDIELEFIVEKIVVIKLLRMNTEGLASQSFSGISESYIDGYPAEILLVMNRKRKIKVV